MIDHAFSRTAKPLSDDQLLDLVQQQTLRYFWDFAHPVSFMARERSNPAQSYDYQETVAIGGTGFGIMAMIAGVERGWLDKDEFKARLHTIVDFLSAAPRYNGAFSHFMHGATGQTIPFSPQDDGGDLVETSFLMAGLLTARQYFADDAVLAEKINTLWHGVDWNFYTRGKDQLYWHNSPKHHWAMNHAIEGWNECLITYVLAASSPTHSIAASVYENGWATGNAFLNGKTEAGVTLPLGPDKGGPLFFAHYSFLGLDPRGLKDKFADYWQQNTAHTVINYAHCVDNPNQHKGYGPACWGLSASDDFNFYAVHDPKNDSGTISPTASLSSFPYTPASSMRALRHFYENMGDKIWGPYGFKDAFNESANWVADSYLAIDQGPIVVMIENYRSGLLWNLLMSCPELKSGLKKLAYDSPHLKTPAP